MIKKKRSVVPRQDSCIVALKKLFKNYPNRLFPTRAIRVALPAFDDCIIYNGVSILFKEKFVTRDMVRGQKVYFLRRKEKGD